LEEILSHLLFDTLAGATDWVVSGFDYASGAGLVATFNGGAAIIQGRYVSVTGTWTVTVADDATTTVYLALTLDGDNKVTDVTVETSTPSGYYLELGAVTAASGSISGGTDTRRTTPAFIRHTDASGTTAGHMRRTGERTYEVVVDNLAANTEPGVSNDNTEGYGVDSRWIDTTAGEAYVCLDASTGAAVWGHITSLAEAVLDSDYTGAGDILVGTGAGTHAARDISIKGTLLVGDGTDAAALSVGANDTFPVAASGEATGIEWRVLAAGDIPSLAASIITSGTLAHERGGLEADVSAYAGRIAIAGGATTEIKDNLTASARPVSTDDSASGYGIRSHWVITSGGNLGEVWLCRDATTSAAVWDQINASGGGSTNLSAVRYLQR